MNEHKKTMNMEEAMQDPEVKEAIEAIMKMHGATDMRVASRRHQLSFAAYRQFRGFLHRFGIHTRYPMSSYNPKTGATQYRGLGCVFCGNANE